MTSSLIRHVLAGLAFALLVVFQQTIQHALDAAGDVWRGDSP